ncbi:hypothetical protein V3C99_011290 [Haemonchus contortus]
MLPRRLPRIRSLVRVTLPKFFDVETYIWNRFSSVDAILVDIRHRDDVDGGEWRRDVLRSALDRAPYKPRIYVQTSSYSTDYDNWKKDIEICSHKNLHGILMTVQDSAVLHEVESIAQRDRTRTPPLHPAIEDIIPPHYKDASVLVDLELGTIPYAIFKYYNFGGPHEAAWNNLEEMGIHTNTLNVMAMAWRIRAIPRMRDLVHEMHLLKDLGFTGVVLHSADFAGVANRIFN